MPGGLPPLPRPRLRQGARRMEPDGALLQLLPRAEHPRHRQLHDLSGQSPSILGVLAAQHHHGHFHPHTSRHTALPSQNMPGLPLRHLITAQHNSCPVSALYPSYGIFATRYRSFPRAATGSVPMISSPRTITTSSIMLTTTQTWFGTIRTTSPTFGLVLLRERSRKPCSSAKRAILASGCSRMRPWPSSPPVSAVSVFEPASRMPRSGAARLTTVE